MIYDIIVSVLPIIIPYIVLGENLTNIILSITAMLYIIFNKKYIATVNKLFLSTILCLIVSALLSIVIIDNNLYALSGISVYFNILMYYIVFRKIINKNKSNKTIIEYIVKISAVVCCISVVCEEIIVHKRLIGNIGYANTYGLILFVMIVFNDIIKLNHKSLINKIFILGILSTSSRTTLAILILYTIMKLIISKLKDTDFILDIVQALIYYLIIEIFKFATIFMIPIFAPILLFLSRKIKEKSNKLIYTAIIATIILFLAIPNNAIERISNISLENGSLQERLITFQDAIEAIKENDFGLGINTYKFSHYEYSTAFYDIKYLHNSILQVAYDIGIIGAIIYTLLFIVANYLVIKSDSKQKFNYLFIINAILLHSMMDFDNIFSVTTIFISLCIASLNIEKGIMNLNCKSRYILILPMIVFMYCGIYEASVKSGIGLELVEKLPIRDYRVYLALSDKEMESYYNSKDKSILNKVKLNLIQSQKYSEDNVIIKWNLAYVYEKLGDYENSIIKRDEVLELQGLYFDVYKEYNKMLVNLYEETGDKYYENKMQELESIYYENLTKLNNKSKYLKNQLPKEYQKALELERE